VNVKVCILFEKNYSLKCAVLLNRSARGLQCRRRPQAGDRKWANLLARSLAHVVPGPLRFLAGSTRVAWFFDCVFECVGFSDVVLDLVCSTILPSDWLAEPCPNDAYVEELVSAKTSCFRTR